MSPLFLFDIDGTLVNLTDVHVAAYQYAYQRITGTAVARESLVQRFGETEQQIHAEVFEEYHLAKRLIGAVVDAYLRSLLERLPTASIRPLPGVTEFLTALKKRGAACGIVTGNVEVTGRRILEQSGLLPFFSAFGYGDGAAQRADIVRRAIEAAKKHGCPFDRVIVIGDSPMDIQAGKANSAFTVGVATGPFPPERLRAADLVLDSLEEYQKILERVHR